ncbi:hypothetical protein AAC978_10130 [Desulfitobacterium sp. THU1]|uniref:hypothetical protein n=1 Tax=Desulfitobacterium sp. THU1 TaxID=3138072 RepID=UPI00311F4BF4
MKSNKELLIKKHKATITPIVKSIEELIGYLKSKIDIEEIDANGFIRFFQPHIPFNVVNSILK